jgi:hypothetical protein
MSDQFDLEQGIMECWNVTSDLDTLFEELVENDDFTKDQASNFVLGLSTIYEAKFNKLFRTFESFLRVYYKALQKAEDYEEDLAHMRAELKEFQDAKYASLQTVYAEESEADFVQRMMEESDLIDLDLVEDEFGFR